MTDAGGTGDPLDVAAERRLRASTERLALIRAFGQQLRARRRAAHLSVSALAARCRVSPSTISKLEAGRGGEPGLVAILIVCDGLAISSDMLLGELPAPQERRPKARQ
ncbi:MAG: helix-turn-helix domain-containing protein [Solirubrobacterales bacterium]|nr:helix-turn-helix domain-containing protein [Solirubrobacterales bacterium]